MLRVCGVAAATLDAAAVGPVTGSAAASVAVAAAALVATTTECGGLLHADARHSEQLNRDGPGVPESGGGLLLHEPCW